MAKHAAIFTSSLYFASLSTNYEGLLVVYMKPFYYRYTFFNLTSNFNRHFLTLHLTSIDRLFWHFFIDFYYILSHCFTLTEYLFTFQLMKVTEVIETFY